MKQKQLFQTIIMPILAKGIRLLAVTALVAGFVFAVQPARPAYAATLTVTTATDELASPGTGCSLREAITLNPGIVAIHYHAAEGLFERSEAQGTAEDLNEAKIECRQAHELIFQQGSDPDGLLPRIVALGEKLGLELAKSP